MSTLIQRYTGALLALIAAFAFTLMDALAQNCMRHGLSPGQVAFGRMSITAPLVTLYIYLRQPSCFHQLDPRKHTRQDDISSLDSDDTLFLRKPALAARLIWLRSILTSIGVCLAFASMQRIAISEFITVYSPRAYLIGFLCWAVLKEAFGWRLRLAAVASSIAVVLVVQPPLLFGASVYGNPASRAAGFFFCLACLLVDTLEMVLLRYLGAGPDPLVITLSYSVACVFVSPCFMLLVGEEMGDIDGWQTCFRLFALAALGLLAQMCVVIAMQKETGGTVSVVLYAQIPFAVIVQSFLIGEAPGVLQIFGMAIIVSFGVWATVAESNEREQAKEATGEEEGYALLPTESEAPIGVHGEGEAK
ncbi:uncharacterized protein MKK02DRAFT_43609 [Dioszegia hungarica]|uniref:EamA domain-containing protein n=1 Tax=Dioszegia hungarica TaxID=4972 RepID=A0AA38HCM2_9TREE|nr:uncharacterized protein MKK02DRAFT_43609 [Dioszegia hungarica]KAI9637683.1 hypothetical protein MKK02DRAFT_43609 [Dioszegia hungarica]